MIPFFSIKPSWSSLGLTKHYYHLSYSILITAHIIPIWHAQELDHIVCMRNNSVLSLLYVAQLQTAGLAVPSLTAGGFADED